jgi:peptidoglycan hydrolase-like protein with peptidoglycan-binding domain
MFRAGRAAAENPADDRLHATLGFSGNTVMVADVSEFQPSINDAVYLRWSQSIVIRAMYGDAHDDRSWFGGERRRALWGGGAKFVGIYQYIVAGQDAGAQARALCQLLGKLNKGEKVIADIEEGGGSQRARWQAWAGIVHSELGDNPWNYSGSFFAQSTGLAPVDWVASYGSAEPGAAHRLWQFTDRFSVPGVGTCDCSVFHGTQAQLTSLAFGGSAPAPPVTDWTEQAIMALPTLSQGSIDRAGTIQYVHRAQALVAVIGQINNVGPAKAVPLNGNFDATTKAGVVAIQGFFNLTRDGVVGPNTWKRLIGV